MPDAAEPQPPAAVAETHISWVFFSADRAYKVLKPIRTPFLDYSTMFERAHACRREFELNMRVSPDVYLGLSPILEKGEVVDHMIVMRRLPDDRRLSTLAGTPGFPDRVREVARAVAIFHASLSPDPEAARVARTDWLTRLWTTENIDQMAGVRSDGAQLHDPVTLEEIRRRAIAYLAGRDRLFEHRIALGHAVDGHGDLLCDDIFCLDDGPRILDCLAFDDDLRRGDVLADVAFLAMDLERLPDGQAAAMTLVDTYDELTAESHPRSLLHFYIAQRALVRAKVRGLRHLQRTGAAGDAAAQAAASLQQCRDHLRTATVRLVLVGGAPGTGKTTAAGTIADVLAATVLSSDELRKDLAGVAHGDHRGAPLDAGLYSEEMTGRTYDELLRRTRELLQMGESVVLDASFTLGFHRALAREAAAATHSEIHELCCVLDPDIAAERVARRVAHRSPAASGDASDATPQIAHLLAGRADPWPEAASIATAGTAEESAAASIAALRASTEAAF